MCLEDPFMRHGFESYPKQFYLGVCHRGLHDAERSENSMKAFANAIEHNMAFELDVHLSKDGILFVCHDSDLLRMTGKAGHIEELTSKEIKEGYRLHDGGEIPTLQEVLDLNQEKVLIVVELKVVNKNYNEVADAAKEILAQIKDPSKIAIICFDPRCLKRFGKSRFERQLLMLKKKDWVRIFRNQFESIDLEITQVKDKWVQRYRRHGGIVNCWTVETLEQLRDVSPYVDAVTFQHIPVEEVIKDREEYLKKRG